VIVGIGYNQGGVYDLQSGTYLDYVERFKSHPAILMWELGNEFNFHPEWFGGSLDLWYETLRKASAAIQAADPNHPVATAHGELPDEALIAEMTDVDVWGLNVYRWDVSYTAAVDFAKLSDKPMYFSEIGADSYMSTAMLGYEQGPNQRAQADATCWRPCFQTRFRVQVLRFSRSPTAGGKRESWTSKMPAGSLLQAAGCPTTPTPTKSTGDWWTSTATPRKPTTW
jgi:beta-galactosidase/beta-glucuronidase